MPILDIYSIDGSKKGTAEVSDSIFAIEPNKSVVHEVLTAELASRRAGTASAKTRAEVRGGGRKPFRQKGTGRARQGSTRAPHMVGGGVVHGPKPRSYVKKVNKKVRDLAIKSALSSKVQNGKIILLEGEMEMPKTKDIFNFGQKLKLDRKQLYVVDNYDNNIAKSVRNLVDTRVRTSYEIDVHSLLKYDVVVLTKNALTHLEEVLG